MLGISRSSKKGYNTVSECQVVVEVQNKRERASMPGGLGPNHDQIWRNPRSQIPLMKSPAHVLGAVFIFHSYFLNKYKHRTQLITPLK